MASATRGIVPYPSPVLTTLDNGLRAAVVALPHLRTTSIVAVVGVGARYESPLENGLSHLVEHMLFRGSRARPSSHALTFAFESLGANLDARTHADFTAYEVTLPPDAVDASLEALAELIDAPLFLGLEVEKNVVREEILESVDEDGREIDADDLLHRAIFGAHPLGQPLAGTETNLDRFTIAELTEWHLRHHGARNIALVVAGAVEPAATLRAIEATFGQLSPGERRRPSPFTTTTPSPRLSYVDSVGSQTDLRIGIPTFGERDPRVRALDFVSRTLDGGMSARLFQTVALERGLVYDVFGSLELYEDVGLLSVGAACDHKNVLAVAETCLGLVRALREGPIAPSELERARRRFLFELEATLDDAGAVAAAVAQSLFFETNETWATLTQSAERVTLDDVHAVAQASLSERHLQIVAVGALEEREERALRSLVRAPD